MNNKRAIQLNDLYKLRLISSNQISPNGELVIYSLEYVDNHTEKNYSNLWIVPTNGKHTRQFTFGDHMDALPKWSPQGDKIAFLSNRSDTEQAQLYIIPLNGGEAQKMTDLHGDFGQYNWSPDGSKIVFQFRRTDKDVLEMEKDETRKELGKVSRRITRIWYKQNGEGFLPQERWHLWILDVRKKRTKQITFHNVFDELDPVWSPIEDKIAFVSNRTSKPDINIDDYDIHVYNLSDGNISSIGTPPGMKNFMGSGGSLSYSPDGKQIAYVGIDGRMQWWKNKSLFIIPSDGNGKARDLLEHEDIYVDSDTCSDTLEFSPTPPAWSFDGSELFFQVVELGNVVLKKVSIDSGKVENVIAEEGIVGDFSFDKTTTKVAYCSASLEYTRNIKIKDINHKTIHRLTSVNQQLLKKVHLGEVETVWIKGYDKNDLQGWIVKPNNFDPQRQYPAILWVHGGPVSMFAHQFSHEYQFFADKGYISFYTNPRGSTGYGEEHLKALWNNWGGKDYQDILAWTDYVSSLPYVDEHNLGVTGSSYGGYMTSWIIGHTNRFKAAIACAIYNNLISGWGSSDYNWGTQVEYANKPPWEDFENLWSQSPMKYIGNAQTPTMVIHSEQDMRCSLEQSEQIFVALQYLGIDSEFIVYPDEPHGITRTDRKIDKLNHMLRWFDKYLK